MPVNRKGNIYEALAGFPFFLFMPSSDATMLYPRIEIKTWR